MEDGGKECEEDTLQTAFKKLRVDAESLSGAVSASEAVTPRSSSRLCLESNGAKPKVVCQKDNWHGSTRKASRGASRTQRRRRSKSPILQPPKFTYCSPAASGLKHQRLVPLEPEPCPSERPAPVVLKEPAAAQSHISALIFGTATETTPSAEPTGESTGSKEKSACDGAEVGPSLLQEASDFRALSELNNNSSSSSTSPAPAPCSCSLSSDTQKTEGSEETRPETSCSCRSSWSELQVYSFTGLRSVVSECERPDAAQRTVSSSAAAARSCSEQARAFVDDITIEDLSGYLEYYLYIPKKMSHMAEMMYT